MRILEITKGPPCRQMPTVCVSYRPARGYREENQHLSELPVAMGLAHRLGHPKITGQLSPAIANTACYGGYFRLPMYAAHGVCE